MFERMRQRLGIAETQAPPRAPAAPSTALVPVPVHRPRADSIVEKPSVAMGYLDRHPDSARPHIPTGPVLRSADAEIRVAHAPVAAAARHMITQSGFLAYGAELNCSWISGPYGLDPMITPDAHALGWEPSFAKTWSAFLRARYLEWCDDPRSCDAQGRLKFGAMQSAAVRSYLATGDVLAILDYGAKAHSRFKTAINLVDPSRLITPPIWTNNGLKVHDGVEYDERGRALAYHLRHLPGAIPMGAAPTIRVPVMTGDGKQMLAHSYDAEAGAVRGISPLGAAIGGIMQSMSAHDAAVLAAHIAATIFGTVTSDLPSDAVARSIGGEDGNALASMMASRVGWHESLKANDAHLRLGHGGRVVHLSTGERFDMHAGKVAFTEYEKIIRLGLAEAARAMGFAPEFLHGLKDGATYSSLKWAAVEARAIMDRRRKLLLEPLTEFALWSLAEELIADRKMPWRTNRGSKHDLEDFRLRRHLIKVEWRGPSIEDPDVMKATNAAINRVRYGLSSFSEEIASTGRDAATVFHQRAADEAMLDELNLQPLPWPTPPAKRSP